MAGLELKQVLSDTEAMSWALAEAKKGEGFVRTNPLVGCAILDANRNLLAVGAHLKYGEAHAEINALNKIPDKSKLEGAQVFVTLEPCASEGKTPSCAKTLSQYGLERVVYACPDPNPKMAGGASVLKAAGIEVETIPSMREKAEVLAEVFLLNQTEKRSFFHLKVGTTLDGLISDSSGKSQWITSEESRREVQRMRGVCDAVLVGRGTFEADNPSLNSRHPVFANKENYAVVLDPKGKLHNSFANSNLVKCRDPKKVIWVTTDKASQDSELVTKCPVKTLESGAIDLRALGEALYSLGIASTLVEGGAATFSQFAKQNCVDRLSLFQSPSLMGSSGALHWLSDFETADLNQRPVLSNVETCRFGQDLFISGNLSN